MYLTRIELHNIRCFEDLIIDLKKNNQITLWTTLLGDNAVGKTTLLRCIALGLCDESRAAALKEEIPGELLRKKENSGHIKLTLENKSKHCTITTKIKRKDFNDPEKIEQVVKFGPNTTWQDIFVCGYGVNRLGERGSSNLQKYKLIEAVYSLFVPSGLLYPELILLRQNEELRTLITKKLLKILMLDDNKSSIEFTNTGMIIVGPWGEFTIDELSDGYRSTTSWFVDFFAWQIFADKLSSSNSIEGIILIDEIENHLHPKWQGSIVEILKTQLPEVQIISTSHSPIIASTVGDLLDENNSDKLIHLQLNPGNIVESSDLSDYKGLDINQILASKAFDYQIYNEPKMGGLFRKISELKDKKVNLSPIELKTYNKFKELLKKRLLLEGKTWIEREVEFEHYEELKKDIKDLEEKLFNS